MARKAKTKVRGSVRSADDRFAQELAKATRQAMELSMMKALARHEAWLNAHPEHPDAKERERLFRALTRLRGKLRVTQQFLNRQATI